MARGGAGAGTRSLPARLAARLPAASPSHLLTQAHGALRAAVAQEAEQRRLFPWLAVAFGLGILVEFHATDGPPALAAPLLAAGAAAAVTPLLRARPVALALTLAFVAALLGFAAAAYRVASVASPVLARPVIVPLAGLVEALDEREEGARLIVRVTALGTLSEAERPARVRVSYRRAGAAAGVRPGDAITATARLLPPPEAARPGGYDFARDAYFRSIGAVGSLVGRIDIRAPEDEQPWTLRAAAGIDAARNALTRRIGDAIGGQAGAVAAALVTGKRGLIAPATNDVLRAAGIYHVVSISGLHMVLAAGVVFWLTRALLCLVPALALAAPVKKIAAATAMLGVTAYCAFSGWDIAAERSWIMTLVMLGAILVDRPALSLRNLALAAMIALAREPEALLGPSFRMSFGAVAGLIASAPLLDRLGRAGEGGGALARLVARAVVAVAATLGTTLVAQIATAPFSTYHFQAVQPFGLLGNALTLPLVSLVVMPSAVIGVLAYPFALDRPVWWLMGLAVRGMLEISAWIAAFGQANLVLPAYGPAALALFSVALLLATLPVTRLRLLAIAPALAGLALAANPPRPDLYVDRAAAGLALRGADGRLALLGRPSGFVLEQWLRADGDARRPDQVGTVAGARCDRLGCTARSVDGRRIALAKDGRALPEDCARADILVTHRSVPPGCAAGLILDRTFLATHGAAAIRLGSGDAIVTTVRRPGPPRVEDAALAGLANPQQPVSVKPMSIPVGEPGEAGLTDLSPGDVPAEPLQ